MFARPTRYLRRIFAIARTTATELYGQPSVLLLTFGGIVAIALIPFLQLHSFGEAGRLARDGGLAYQLVIGLALAVIAAASSIHEEITEGTAAAALAKPISRNDFIVGKWLGVMSVTFRFWLCTLAAILLAERVAERLEGNEFVTDSHTQFLLFLIPPLALLAAGWLHNRKRIRFCKTALDFVAAMLIFALGAGFAFDRSFAFHPGIANIDLRIVPVSMLIIIALGTYCAIASAIATRLRTGPSMIISFSLLLLGLSSESLMNAPFPASALACLIPNLQSFWMCDALTSGGTLPAGYLLVALLYSAAYASVALGVAMLAFRNKDLP